MTELLAFLQGQQLLTGMIGMAVTGVLLFGLREVPAKTWLAFREAFTVTLLVDSVDEAFLHLSVWLARDKVAKRSRRLMLAEAYDYDQGQWNWEMTIGQGWHLCWFRGRPVVIHRHVQDPDALARAVGGGRMQRLTMITLGRGQGVLRDLVGAAEARYRGDGLVAVYYWAGGGYRLADRRRRRDLATVYMPAAQKARLVEDLAAFQADRDVYLARGIPWRRGYLFEGPPGTGKSTLIHALAGEAGRSIYVVNLNTLMGDNELIEAVNGVGRDGALVFEDIDSAKITRDRDLAPPAPSHAPGTIVALAPAEAKGVTLSGLLNAIDGVASREGRMMFVTSNRAGELDPALLRPGRIDVRETIDRLGWDEAYEMFRAWAPNAVPSAFRHLVGARLPIAAAELQNLLIGLESGPVAAPEEVAA